MTMLKWTSISGSTDPSSFAHTNFPSRAEARNIWCVLGQCVGPRTNEFEDKLPHEQSAAGKDALVGV
jgi:hypothetical protein